MAKTYRHKAQLCPACGYLFDASSNAIGEGDPKPGDYSLCFSCGEVLQYSALGPTVRAQEPLELDLGQLARVRKMQRFIRQRGQLGGRHRPKADP